MGELVIQLTDVIYQNKQKLKRKPFGDRSNLYIMNTVQKQSFQRKSNRVIKPKTMDCSCCIGQDSAKFPEHKRFKDLKVVLERFNWDGLCTTNKIKLHNNKKVNVTEEIARKEADMTKQLHTDLFTPPMIEQLNARKKLYDKTNSKLIRMKNSDGINNSLNAKASSEDINAHVIINEKALNKAHIVKFLNQIENSSSAQKTTDKIKNIDSNTPIIQKLRERERKNYMETSVFSPDNKSIIVGGGCTKKVPIYKKMNIEEDINKKDPYELDLSDVEEKSSKIIKSRNPSEKFNKTMYEIIKKLEKKHVKKSKKKKYIKNTQRYNKNIKSVLHRVMEKVDNKKHANNNLNKLLDTGQANINISASQYLNNIEFQYKTPINVQDCQNNPQDKTCSANTYLVPASLLNENIREDEQLFGFDEENEQEIEQPNTRVNIINNIILNPSSHDKKSFAHTTIRKNLEKSPWRLNGIRNSNYVILYKKNALPCLKQDAVLSYNLTERIEESFSKNKSNLQTPKKSHIQTSILDYINSPHNTTPIQNKENMQEKTFFPSLYDYEEFDIHSNNITNKKRTVLGVIQDHDFNKKVAVSTPLKKNYLHTMPCLDISVIGSSDDTVPNEETNSIQSITLVDKNNDNFGFNSRDSNIHEETKCLVQAKPFRISVGAIKNYKTQVKNNGNTDNYVHCAEDLPSILTNNEQEENSCEEINIFDDVEPELLMSVDTHIQYGRKGRRRQRLMSVTSEYSDDDKPKKKKKNAMTKTEEEEFEKWATQFNAMCSEIEKHNLEVE